MDEYISRMSEENMKEIVKIKNNDNNNNNWFIDYRQPKAEYIHRNTHNEDSGVVTRREGV